MNRSSVFFDKTLYASPYMVVTDQEYTKHYYIEGERVCTKTCAEQSRSIGGGFWGTAPMMPNDNALQFMQGDEDWLKGSLFELVNKNIQCAEYYGQWDINPVFAHLGNKANMAEYNQYFYHSDHLGSASFITDATGYVDQHIQYLPFGELFISQRNSTFDSRYKFTAKELDNETNYTYFGARYYDSDLSIWLSIDPLSDKYPSLSPYAYCANNPIIYIDPDGERITFGLFGFRERRLFNRVYRSADAETRGKYDVLKSSNVNYRINITNLSDRAGGTTYNFQKDRVEININPNSNNMVGAMGDELETAYQYQVGDIGFVLGSDGVVGTLGYDMSDEVASKRAEIKATEAVNKFEGKNIQLDKTTQAFRLADEGPITQGMTRNQMIEYYFKTDVSAQQYLNLFQPAIRGLHTGGANMQNKISGTGGYTIQQLEEAKQQGAIRDFKYNGQK